MAFTYDTTTDLGKVRLMITDTNPALPQFQDNEVQVFLDLNGGNLFLAAAQGLDTIAVNETLIQKRTKSLNLETDGPAVAASLRKLAESYRERAEADSGFETVEVNSGGWSQQQILTNELYRTGG